MSALMRDPRLELALPSRDDVLDKAPAENFPVALRVLPARHRTSLMAIYGYARLVDEVGDELDRSPADRLAMLDVVEAELDAAFAGSARHPVFRRLMPVIEGCGLDRQPFADLIEANRADQTVAHYETFDELLGYCRLSANPVGRLVLGVFGQRGDERVQLSDLVCSALQLVEHFQDIAEDAARGRVYVPGEDLDRFLVPRDLEEVPVEGETPAAFRRLMAFEVTRARSMLEEGSRLVRLLDDRSAALAIAGFAGGGLAQLDAIERAGYDVLSTQVKASRVAIARRALGLLAGAATRARRRKKAGPWA